MKFLQIQESKVPALGYGTFQIQGDACRQGVRQALELGYRHIDTAQMYENETEVGKGIADSGVPRDEIFLTTKLWWENLRSKDVAETARASLRKLDTDHVDLLLIHWPNDDVPLSETLGAMKRLREEGLVRHLGVSNFPPSLLQKALDEAPIFCNQVEYHPFLGQGKLLEMARENDLMLTAYSPLARGQVPENDVLNEIGRAHGKSPAQVTLRWFLQQDHVAAIPKASSAEHRQQNFDVFDFELSDGEMERISSLDRGERLIDPDFGPDWE